MQSLDDEEQQANANQTQEVLKDLRKQMLKTQAQVDDQLGTMAGMATHLQLVEEENEKLKNDMSAKLNESKMEQ